MQSINSKQSIQLMLLINIFNLINPTNSLYLYNDNTKLNIDNMNGNVYDISNRNTTSNIKFSTLYNEINETYEYFDIYSPPITSRYADVYWTMMDPVILPKKIVNRFKNSIIAIVGYETDQVFVIDSKNNSKDISVPITWTYNHHYEAYLHSENTQMIKINNSKHNTNDWGIYNHGAKKQWEIFPKITNVTLKNGEYITNNLFFSEANGGEFRASFHGYPNGYAQLLQSPKYFSIQPMQIDTRNRDPKYINDTIFHPGILPNNSAAPENADYSGLLECPCTTRINKTIIHNYNTKSYGICSKPILNPNICYNQTILLNKNYNISNITIKNQTMYPYGCSFIQNEKNIIPIINVNKSGSICNSKSKLYEGSMPNDPITNTSICININLSKSINQQLEITFIGPSKLWFGFAFNAYLMSDLPYAIIVNGTGHVFEVKLENHGPGKILAPSISLISNSINNNTRKIKITRPLKGNNTNYYTFNISNTYIPILTAIGSTGKYSYHHLKSSNSISLKSINGLTCICDDGISGKINGIPFSKKCAAEPIADLLQQHNPSCFIDTYQGGLSCCHHKNILLDKEQIQPKHQMTYHLKFRFWFQNYTNHKSLLRFYFQTEAYSGEYDVPKCIEGTPNYECIHSITARWQAKNMINKNLIGNSKGLSLIYAAPHCHAPTCISMELYNSDTGDLICRVEGLLGNGNTNNKYDERGYIKLNPCLWGNDDGLLKPTFIPWNTNLTSIKKNNNTNAHYGEMASWQMRGILNY